MATEPQPTDTGELDLTQDDASPADAPAPKAIPYDPEKAREDVRGKLALALVKLLAFVIVAAFASVWIPVIVAWKNGGYIDVATPLKTRFRWFWLQWLALSEQQPATTSVSHLKSRRHPKSRFQKTSLRHLRSGELRHDPQL